MKGLFLGSAEEIGRLGFVLDWGGNRFLFDYGLEPDRPPQYPLPAPAIDRVFLTHAHLDHSGMLPWIAARNDAAMHMTPVSGKVATLMHRDSLKIARSENFPEPYSDRDIDATMGLYDFWGFDEPHQLGGVEASLACAGHIPGAAQVMVERDGLRLGFTGDLYVQDQRLVRGADPVKCDVLFMESTYAGKEQPARATVEAEFLAYADEVVARGGILIVPSFAVGRAQELAMVLADKGFNVWMDGMSRAVTQIYLDHPEYLRDARAFKHAIGQIKMVRNHRGRDVALSEAHVILTTGGMLDGGPVLYYLNRLRNDPKAGVAITGYQVEGTNGQRLRDEGVLDFDNRDPGKEVHKVHCEVRSFNFSAHAGHSELVAHAKRSGAKDVVLFHGDHRERLVDDLSKFATVHLPMKGSEFTLQ